MCPCTRAANDREEQVTVHVTIDNIVVGEIPFYYFSDGLRNNLEGEMIDLNGHLADIHQLMDSILQGGGASASPQGGNQQFGSGGQQGETVYTFFMNVSSIARHQQNETDIP